MRGAWLATKGGQRPSFPWHTFCCGCQWHRGSESPTRAVSRSQRSGLGGHSLSSKEREWWEGEGWCELWPKLVYFPDETDSSPAWPPCGGPWGAEWKEFWVLLHPLWMPTVGRECCRDGLNKQMPSRTDRLCRLLETRRQHQQDVFKAWASRGLRSALSRRCTNQDGFLCTQKCKNTISLWVLGSLLLVAWSWYCWTK